MIPEPSKLQAEGLFDARNHRLQRAVSFLVPSLGTPHSLSPLCRVTTYGDGIIGLDAEANIRFPYVDGPLLARLFGQCSDQIACVHMSGLFSRSHMNAGQDGFRDASSKHPSDLWRPVESTECLASWID